MGTMYECYECEIVVNVDHVFICNPYLLHNYCFFKICIFDGGPGVTESPSWVDTYLFLMSILWGRFFIIMTYNALVSHTYHYFYKHRQVVSWCTATSLQCIPPL